MSELKNCPFCGSKARSDQELIPIEAWCPNIECFMFEIGMPIDKWNTRRPPAGEGLDEDRVEELAEFMYEYQYNLNVNLQHKCPIAHWKDADAYSKDYWRKKAKAICQKYGTKQKMGEEEIIFKIAKITAENDSIYEGYNYNPEYTIEEFNKEKKSDDGHYKQAKYIFHTFSKPAVVYPDTRKGLIYTWLNNGRECDIYEQGYNDAIDLFRKMNSDEK